VKGQTAAVAKSSILRWDRPWCQGGVKGWKAHHAGDNHGLAGQVAGRQDLCGKKVAGVRAQPPMLFPLSDIVVWPGSIPGLQPQSAMLGCIVSAQPSIVAA